MDFVKLSHGSRSPNTHSRRPEAPRHFGQRAAGHSSGQKITIAQILKDPDKRDMDAIKQIGTDCMDSEDFHEGRRAFMKKRKPQFHGR